MHRRVDEQLYMIVETENEYDINRGQIACVYGEGDESVYVCTNETFIEMFPNYDGDIDID